MRNYLYILGLGIMFMLSAPHWGHAQVNPDRIPAAMMQESIKAILGKKTQPEWHQFLLSDSLKQELQRQLKAKNKLPDTLFIGRAQTKKGVRFLIPDIAPSRSEYFSYLLFVDSQPEIVAVDVLKYRENYGYQIDYPFFRKQFQGAKNPEKIIFGRTIQNISGATISARSFTYSIRDLLLILNHIELPE
jgi:hypothetical protein